MSPSRMRFTRNRAQLPASPKRTPEAFSQDISTAADIGLQVCYVLIVPGSKRKPDRVPSAVPGRSLASTVCGRNRRREAPSSSLRPPSASYPVTLRQDHLGDQPAHRFLFYLHPLLPDSRELPNSPELFQRLPVEASVNRPASLHPRAPRTYLSPASIPPDDAATGGAGL